MAGITIEDEDKQGALVPLQNVLNVIGERGLKSIWVLNGVDALGETAAQQLHQLSDAGTPISGHDLIGLLQKTWQVIDGKFNGYDSDEELPWIAIHAVDSTAYDVITDDDDALERLRSDFRCVTELPTSAYTWPPVR